MGIAHTGGAGRLVRAERYRHGRNYVAVGDTVRIRPTPGRRNGFRARVRAIKLDRTTGEAMEVEVFGGPAGREMVRTFSPERIQRVATRVTNEAATQGAGRAEESGA
ncbi:MAG TPA: hypothetical protein VFJ85_01875 [Acidimicrobiales bacterium]|nr:hypothetical protein [Acidimicrobiales bacterium]